VPSAGRTVIKTTHYATKNMPSFCIYTTTLPSKNSQQAKETTTIMLDYEHHHPIIMLNDAMGIISSQISAEKRMVLLRVF